VTAPEIPAFAAARIARLRPLTCQYIRIYKDSKVLLQCKKPQKISEIPSKIYRMGQYQRVTPKTGACPEIHSLLQCKIRGFDGTFCSNSRACSIVIAPVRYL
jgi:hypothetical protein